MPLCNSYLRSDAPPSTGWHRYTLCNGGVSVALPGPSTTSISGTLLPSKTFRHAMLLVNVTHAGGNFSIGPCDGYEGTTRQYAQGHYTAEPHAPLVVAVLGQCAAVTHSPPEYTSVPWRDADADAHASQGSSSSSGSRQSADADDDGSITFDIALIGDYCAALPASPYCSEYDKRAVDTESVTSVALPRRSNATWRRVLVACTLAAVTLHL